MATKMTADKFYKQAMENGVELECTCVDISSYEWDELMKGAVRANKKKLLKAVGMLDKYHNPYDFFRTKTHLIYVNSAVEYFYRVL